MLSAENRLESCENFMSSSRRLRGTQPPGTDHSSSASSISSKIQDKLSVPAEIRRETSMTKSLTPQSSSDEVEGVDPAERETRRTRQQKREVSNLDGSNEKPNDEDLDEEDADGEVTRCVCGQLEYPGPPVPLSDNGRHSSRDNGRLASLAAAEGLPEDAGGLFIQCDDCHVWQHGGCVGIMQEETSPDNYYCEQCRTDMHRVSIGARG